MTDFIAQLEVELKTDNFTAFAGTWQVFIEDRMEFFRSKLLL